MQERPSNLALRKQDAIDVGGGADVPADPGFLQQDGLLERRAGGHSGVAFLLLGYKCQCGALDRSLIDLVDGQSAQRVHEQVQLPASRDHRVSQPGHHRAVEGLPPTLLLVDEVDPLRDEGEAYAAKLRMAGVPVTTVRYDGVVHDCMLLNAMSEANATRAAIAQATAFLRQAFGSD
jgi:hypothetical protein